MTDDGIIPLPPELDYAPPTGRYFSYVWDTTDVPFKQDFGDVVVITPTFDGLIVYGREVGSIFPEDAKPLRELNRRGRISGEWFSVACPIGELGTYSLAECKELTVTEFSEAYKRGWKE